MMRYVLRPFTLFVVLTALSWLTAYGAIELLEKLI